MTNKTIRKIIVQSMNNVTVTNNPLKDICTEDELRKEFAKQKLPILSVSIDSVGTALVVIAKNLF